MTTQAPDTTPPDRKGAAWRRVLSALQGEPVDQVPMAFWRHFYRQERSPEALAEATWALVEGLDLDLAKLTSGSFYAIEDWGAQIQYPEGEDSHPSLKRPVIRAPEGWRNLPSLDPKAGALRRELEAIGRLRALDQGRVPLLVTLYSPLTVARKLAGPAVVEHLREDPQALHIGLAIITETTARFARQALSSGADGLFFASQLASRAWLTEAEYETFGTRYDLMVLETVQSASRMTVLHLHGEGVYFDLANRYPVHAVSWDAGADAPSLAEAHAQTDKALVGGLDRGLLRQGPVEAIVRQAQQAIRQTQGRRLILAPSCVLLPGTPEAHLLAVRNVVRS